MGDRAMEKKGRRADGRREARRRGIGGRN